MAAAWSKYWLPNWICGSHSQEVAHPDCQPTAGLHCSCHQQCRGHLKLLFHKCWEPGIGGSSDQQQSYLQFHWLEAASLITSTALGFAYRSRCKLHYMTQRHLYNARCPLSIHQTFKPAGGFCLIVSCTMDDSVNRCFCTVIELTDLSRGCWRTNGQSTKETGKFFMTNSSIQSCISFSALLIWWK